MSAQDQFRPASDCLKHSVARGRRAQMQQLPPHAVTEPESSNVLPISCCAGAGAISDVKRLPSRATTDVLGHDWSTSSIFCRILQRCGVTWILRLRHRRWHSAGIYHWGCIGYIVSRMRAVGSSRRSGSRLALVEHSDTKLCGQRWSCSRNSSTILATTRLAPTC